MSESSDAAAADAIDALLDYWFDADVSDATALQAQSRRWFMSSVNQDRELEQRFGELARAAAGGKLDHWADTARGRLALVLLLDQLPRNLHRGTPDAFAQDPKALALCREAIDTGQADELPPLQRGLLLMPLQHSESREVQDLSVASFEQLATIGAAEPLATALRNFADYATLHRDIIVRFGRFPHRNALLGRESGNAEIEFLESGGPSFGQ